MANFTFKQLRYFEALARHGHFGRAAAACAISQPALSVQIRDLEEDLGRPLFERGARAVRLTAFGESFANRVRDILASVEALDDWARASDAGLSGRFRLGVIPTIAPYLLPRLIRDLDAAYPALDLHVRETLTPRLVRELVDAELDAAIVALPVSEPALEEVPLFSERFVFVRPEAQAAKPAPRGTDLSNMRLLLLEEGHCFRDQALAFCSTPGAVPRSGLDGSSLATLVQMVGAGIGVTVIPEMAVPVETRSAAVSCTPFRGPQPSRQIGLVWRRTNPLKQQLHGLAEVVRRAGEPGAEAGAIAPARPDAAPA